VAVALASSPAGAEVFRGDHRIGATPTIDRVARSDAAVEYRFVLPGHLPAVESIVPSEDRTLDVRLRSTRRGPAGGSSPAAGIKTSM
jgi:hypothetical protein